MLTPVRACLLCVPLVITALVACGGMVVVDLPGAGGNGGATGTTASSSSSGWTGSTTTSSSGTTTSSSGWSSSSSSSGSLCDNSGDCGACQSCAIEEACWAEWDACMSTECYALLDCFQNCWDDACYEDCLQQYPDAQEPYIELAICVVCDACYSDCDGPGSGCP